MPVESPVRFICPGAQKAATSTLHAVLDQHPRIFLPACKETHFFDDDYTFERGPDHYREAFYADAPPDAVAGDITPKYLYDPRVPQRIVDTIGTDLDFVILLREPVGRAYSHYWMRRGKGLESRPFEEVARAEAAAIRRLGPDDPSLMATDAYLHRGFYAAQVARYLDAFDPDRILCLLFEDFVAAPDAHTETILRHIGLEPVPAIDASVRKNEAALVEPSLLRRLVRNDAMRAVAGRLVPGAAVRRWVSRGVRGVAEQIEQRRRVPIRKPPLDPALRAELQTVFADDMARLTDLTGLSTDRWTS